MAERLGPRSSSVRRVMSMMDARGGPRRPEREYGVTPQQHERLGRYVGRFMLLGGDHHDDESVRAAAEGAATTLEEHGFLQPDSIIGVTSVVTARDPKNVRLTNTQQALCAALEERGGTPQVVCGRAHVLHGSGNGSETVRSYNALDGIVRRFEDEVEHGDGETDTLDDGHTAIVAVVGTRWAARVFKGVDHMVLSEPGQLAVLHDTGAQTIDHRWSSSLTSGLSIPVHD